LGAVRQDLNKLPEAEAALREALQVRRDSLPPQHPEIANSLNNMVNILRRQDKTNDVEAFAREALAIREKQIPDNWRTFNSKAVLGLVLYDQGRYADAESYMLAGYEGLRQRLPQMHSNAKGRCLEAAEHLVLLYQATGKEEQARRWKSTVAEITREIEPLPGAK
jgi:serine/threonine-protein kinase